MYVRMFSAEVPINSQEFFREMRRSGDEWAAPGRSRRCGFAIVEVLVQPRRAADAGVLVAPLLVRVEPSPAVWIVGTSKDHGRVAQTLGLLASRRRHA